MATSLSWCKFASKKVLKERQTQLILISLAEKKTKKTSQFSNHSEDDWSPQGLEGGKNKIERN